MIYKLKVEGYKYPIHINADLIPIMYIRKKKKNWYELMAIIGNPNETLHHYCFTINAIDNRNFIEIMGGEVEE